MSNGYDSFVFTHIPKCGGSSFRKLIHQSALDSGIDELSIYIPGEGKISHDANLGQLEKNTFSQLKTRNIKILADHTKYEPQTYSKLGMANPFIYTIFRKPKERFISHYNFFYKQVGMAKCKGVEIKQLPKDKLLRIMKSLANLQSAYILGIKPGIDNQTEIENRYDELIEIIQNKITSFGILEQMEDSQKLLKTKLPSWLKINNVIPRINTTNQQQIVKSYGRVNMHFKNFNQVDNKLYQDVVAIFNTRSINS